MFPCQTLCQGLWRVHAAHRIGRAQFSLSELVTIDNCDVMTKKGALCAESFHIWQPGPEAHGLPSAPERRC